MTKYAKEENLLDIIRDLQNRVYALENQSGGVVTRDTEIRAESDGGQTFPLYIGKETSEAIDALNPSLYVHLDTGDGVTDMSGNGNVASVANVEVGHDENYPPTSLHERNSSYFNGQAWNAGGSAITWNGYTPFSAGSNFTAMGWAKLDSGASSDSWRSLMGTSYYAAGVILALQQNDGLIYFDSSWSGAGAAATWTNPIVTGEWFHWALVFDNTNDKAELWINGNSKGKRTVTGDYDVSPNALQIGRSLSLIGTWKGQMSHFAFWQNTLLTEDQIHTVLPNRLGKDRSDLRNITVHGTGTNRAPFRVTGPGQVGSNPTNAEIISSTNEAGLKLTPAQVTNDMFVDRFPYSISADDGANGFRITRYNSDGTITHVMQVDNGATNLGAAGPVNFPGGVRMQWDWARGTATTQGLSSVTQVITGLSRTFTPPFPCYALISYTVEGEARGNPNLTAGGMGWYGDCYVDGASQKAAGRGTFAEFWNYLFGSGDSYAGASARGSAWTPLTVASHTIDIRVTGYDAYSGRNVYPDQCTFQYILFPQ